MNPFEINVCLEIIIKVINLNHTHNFTNWTTLPARDAERHRINDRVRHRRVSPSNQSVKNDHQSFFRSRADSKKNKQNKPDVKSHLS